VHFTGANHTGSGVTICYQHLPDTYEPRRLHRLLFAVPICTRRLLLPCLRGVPSTRSTRNLHTAPLHNLTRLQLRLLLHGAVGATGQVATLAFTTWFMYVAPHLYSRLQHTFVLLNWRVRLPLLVFQFHVVCISIAVVDSRCQPYRFRTFDTSYLRMLRFATLPEPALFAVPVPVERILPDRQQKRHWRCAFVGHACHDTTNTDRGRTVRAVLSAHAITQAAIA